MPPPASSHDPGIDGVKARDDGRHVGQEPCIVEAGVQARKGQALRDARVGGEEVVERASLVCGAERAALNDRIRLLPRHPAVLDERDEDARGRVEAQSPLDVLAHPLGPDDQALDEAGHLRQHVVEEDRGVREEHPLGAAVADVALVPERLVLQRRACVAAQEPGQPGDPLAHDRVALVGHRGAALLTGPEGLHQLPDLGVLEVADLGGEAFEGTAGDRNRGHDRGVPVALDDLGAHRVGVEPKIGEDLCLEVRGKEAVRADGTGDLAGRHVVEGACEARAVAGKLERPARQLEPERGGFRMDRVGPAHHHRVGLGPGASDQRDEECISVAQEEIAGSAELERQPGVDDVAARQAKMEEATLRADRFRDLAHERDHVVVGDHDVIAFVSQVAESVGPEGRFLHLGLTSSDVVDTGLALQLRAAGDLLLGDADALLVALVARARSEADTVMMGRTHSVHAEPTTLGLKLAGWAFELARDRARLARAFDDMATGKISGPVGTYSLLAPDLEAEVLADLGLDADPVSTQIVQRDRHAAVVAAIAITGGSLERFATEVRNLQHTEIGELMEPFRAGQKGSSAMPHKRNPIMCERIAGLARLLRGYAGAALENQPLWHERDISHSSAEPVSYTHLTLP